MPEAGPGNDQEFGDDATSHRDIYCGGATERVAHKPCCGSSATGCGVPDWRRASRHESRTGATRPDITALFITPHRLSGACPSRWPPAACRSHRRERRGRRRRCRGSGRSHRLERGDGTVRSEVSDDSLQTIETQLPPQVRQSRGDSARNRPRDLYAVLPNDDRVADIDGVQVPLGVLGTQSDTAVAGVLVTHLIDRPRR